MVVKQTGVSKDEAKKILDINNKIDHIIFSSTSAPDAKKIDMFRAQNLTHLTT